MSSDSDEENILRYGTPLEPYEDDDIPSKRKYQEPSDQYAVDDHGRRRFHGAFTGGFSAGFGNTVGTPEGWTPSTFKSSRKDKAQISSQRAEDFMDEEDRSEFGIAPRQMQTHSEFSGHKRPRPRQFHDGPIPGEPVLEQLIRPVHETAAVRILKRMGWREGQGAGERVTKRDKRKARDRHKVYGCYMPDEMRKELNQENSESSDSEFEYSTLFAPDDYAPYVVHRKSDKFGVGYSGLSRHSVLGSMVGEYGDTSSTNMAHLKMRDQGKKVSIRGQAFGVGAFETEDDDIYATEDMSHYDFTLGGPTKEQKKPVAQKSGHTLEGFVKSTKPLPAVPSYPPPALPRDYVPAAAGSRRTRFEPCAEPPRDQGLGRHELSPSARGALLGESPLPIQAAPIQTPIQPPIQAQEDPIAKLLGRNVNFVTCEELSKDKEKVEDFISIKDSGKSISKTFRPFVGNPAKQSRYEKYLSDKGGYLEEVEMEGCNIGSWEKERELMEFEQAAKLYQPLSGVIGDRFTHASEPDDAVNPLAAVAKSSINYGLVTQAQVDAAKTGVYGVMTRKKVDWAPHSLVCKRFNVPEPGMSSAQPPKEDKPKVSYSIFSYLETSVHDKESFAKEQSKFSGSKSISTDTIIKPSHKDIQEPSSSKSSTESSSFKYVDSRNNDTGNTTEGSFKKRMTVAEMFLKESEKSQKEGKEVTETIEKFDKMDLYKSIFLSDEEEEVEVQKTDDKPKEIDFDELIGVAKNVERNTSPPKGIFANIDFDEMNSWRKNANTDSKSDKNDKRDGISNEKEENKDKNVKGDGISNEKDSNKEKVNETLAETEYYGPKIPETLQKRLEDPVSSLDNFRPIFTKNKTQKVSEIHEIDSSSSSDSWVEAKDIKNKKSKKKKSKKHKSKHKKSKHKKKDR